MCVVYRMCVRIYRQLPARLGPSAQLGLARRLLGNSPYTLHSHLLGNSPIIPPFQPRRVLPPSPAICLPTWTLSMLSHGPPLTWVENNDKNSIMQLMRAVLVGKLAAKWQHKTNNSHQTAKRHGIVNRNAMRRLHSVLSLELSEAEKHLVWLRMRRITVHIESVGSLKTEQSDFVLL